MSGRQGPHILAEIIYFGENKVQQIEYSARVHFFHTISFEKLFHKTFDIY